MPAISGIPQATRVLASLSHACIHFFLSTNIQVPTTCQMLALDSYLVPCSWGICILGIKVNRQTNTQMVIFDAGKCY